MFQRKHLSGVHVTHHKNTAESATVVMPLPKKLLIPTALYHGKPCEPIVKVGDHVNRGQIIAEPTVLFAVPLHAPASGKITAIEDFIMPHNVTAKAITIATDTEQITDKSVKPPIVKNKEEFIEAVKKSGIVGLGGAAFPTFIKLNPKNPEAVKTLIINGAECEPYITSDYRTMLEDTDVVITAVELIRKYCGIERVIIGIEKNKPSAIRLFNKIAIQKEYLTVKSLRTLYPQGDEKVLIFETTGKVVPEGKLPADIGVIVLNVTTLARLGKYFETGMPLITKRVTLDGGAIANPQNVEVAIGTPISDLIEFCGGYKTDPKKILLGGPMMGVALPNDAFPILKSTNAILALDKKQSNPPKITPCIQCGRCFEVCPYHLMPAAFERSYYAQDIKGLQALHAARCMECGCCAFSCPAKRDLVATNRLAKNLVKIKSEKSV